MRHHLFTTLRSACALLAALLALAACGGGGGTSNSSSGPPAPVAKSVEPGTLLALASPYELLGRAQVEVLGLVRASLGGGVWIGATVGPLTSNAVLTQSQGPTNPCTRNLVSGLPASPFNAYPNLVSVASMAGPVAGHLYVVAGDQRGPVLARISEASCDLDPGFGQAGVIGPITLPGRGPASAGTISVARLQIVGPWIYMMTAVGGIAQTHVHRFSLAGEQDMSFGTGGVATLFPFGGLNGGAFWVAPTGEVWVAGNSERRTNFVPLVAKLNSLGQLDTTFGSGGFADVSAASLGNMTPSVVIGSPTGITVLGYTADPGVAGNLNSNMNVMLQLQPSSGQFNAAFGGEGSGWRRWDAGYAGSSITTQAVRLGDGRIVTCGHALRNQPSLQQVLVLAVHESDGRALPADKGRRYNVDGLDAQATCGALMQWDAGRVAVAGTNRGAGYFALVRVD